MTKTTDSREIYEDLFEDYRTPRSAPYYQKIKNLYTNLSTRLAESALPVLLAINSALRYSIPKENKTNSQP
jgi:hypothetical protein